MNTLSQPWQNTGNGIVNSGYGVNLLITTVQDFITAYVLESTSHLCDGSDGSTRVVHSQLNFQQFVVDGLAVCYTLESNQSHAEIIHENGRPLMPKQEFDLAKSILRLT